MAYSTSSYRPHKRTVRCSYCGERGHNRAGCEAHKERIETLRKEHGDDHYNVRSYDQKKARKASKAKVRKCSYCDTVGHNRATCPELKTHIAETKASNAVFRQRLNDCFVGLGFGIGAIVSSGRDVKRVEGTTGDYWNVPQVVTSINWDSLNYWNNNYSYFDDETAPFFMKPIAEMARNAASRGAWIKDRDVMTMVLNAERAELFLSEEQNWRSKDVDYYFVQIQSPVPATEPPCAWLDGGGAEIKKAYKDRQFYQGAI